METVVADRSAVRRKYKDLRLRLTPAQRAAAAMRLQANLGRFLKDYHGVPCGLYKARAEEAPCLQEPETDFYFPRIEGQGLEFHKPSSAAAFQLNSFSIAEPIPAQSVVLDPSQPGVVCCPAVAVDRGGQRLGMGQGFYDRFFAQHPQHLRVGVVFQVQVSGSPLPAESWDQAVDWIVTEDMVLRTSSPTRSSQSWI